VRAIVAGAAVAVAVTLLLAFGIDDVLELPAGDAALRSLPQRPASHSVVVAIDEASLDKLGPWPWGRDVLAKLVDRAAAGGARAVIFDVLLAENREHDDVLAQSMRRIPTITVAVLNDQGKWLTPPPPISEAATPAHGNFEYDRDGILRRFSATKQNADRALIALPLEASSIVTGAPVPVGRSIVPAFRTPPRNVPQFSAAALMEKPANLRGKLVFIGPTAQALSDRVLTPVSRRVADPGVTVHAAATESLIRGDTIRQIPPIVAGLIAGAIVVGNSRRRGRRRHTEIAVAFAIVIIIGGLALLANGIQIPFVALLLTVVVSTIAVEAIAMRRTTGQLEIRLEEIATRIAEVRAQEAESKRVLAHELKTPLASMRGLTQLLSEFDLTEPERKRVAKLLSTEAGKLESMVTGLLDLERLPLRDFSTSSTVVNLSDLVAARVAFLQASTNRMLSTSIEPGLFVRADAALVERVVDNLVGNAIKYSPAPAPVSIKIRQNGPLAVLDVEDRGVGIPAEERERVFRRFVRGSSAKGTEGLGLGLSLVAEVARWHGGSVSVDDARGGGALFHFALPIGPSPALRALSPREPGEGPRSGGEGF
jgi:signal transduction histidine kinase